MQNSREIDRFSALERLPVCRAAFIGRLPEIDVAVDREAALARLKKSHDSLRAELGFAPAPFATAEQIHGNQIAAVKNLTEDHLFPGVDGLITNQPNICLGIYVADCAAVYLVEKTGKAAALVHSGKKGTELGIVPAAIHALQNDYGCDPANIVVQISPCIRPPHYEVDFAAEILRQAQTAGVEIHDEGICTASSPDHYYSYRREKGQTGRMLALLMLVPHGEKI
ncbi:MAG: polyphenol oxidase family protein [Chthoniobacterales bacterium]